MTAPGTAPGQAAYAGQAHDTLSDAIHQAMSEAHDCRTKGDCPGCTRAFSAALEAGENYARAAIAAAAPAGPAEAGEHGKPGDPGWPIETRELLKIDLEEANKALREETRYREQFTGEILQNCGDEPDESETAEDLAVRYVRSLEAAQAAIAAACSHRDILAAALARIEARTEGYDPGTNEYDVHEIASDVLARPGAAAAPAGPGAPGCGDCAHPEADHAFRGEPDACAWRKCECPSYREPQLAPGLPAERIIVSPGDGTAIGGLPAHVMGACDEHEQPQAAPELAAAMADTVALSTFEDIHQQLLTAQAELDAAYTVNDGLRELLDEIGVLAANAPEDGDSFALLEDIAMRIAAADVPEEGK